MKYRIVKRAKGWVVQRMPPSVQAITTPPYPIRFNEQKWMTIATHRWHWLAALHLLWLREMARRK